MKNGEIWGTLPKIWDKSKRWENLKAKSLKAFCDKYKPKYAVRTSMSDFRQQDWMTNIPLYNIEKNDHSIVVKLYQSSKIKHIFKN